MQGEYNIAFVIDEWRNGVKVGSMTRDMQIEILACNNNPPVIVSVDDTCVTAGESLNFPVMAYDIDGDSIALRATGGPFEVEISPASIDPAPALGRDTVFTTFSWKTACAHVQNQPYQIFFKASDFAHPVSLVSYKTVSVTVVCPAPENLAALAVGSTIRLTWDRVICDKAYGYRVYRRVGFSGYLPETCITGVPPETGYVLIHENESIADTSYTDDDNGVGLIHGNEYCYLVTAWFLDEAESYASNEACATLKRDIPVITNVSNDSADLQAGRGFIAWSKPTELDTIQIPGPYQYIVNRSDGSVGANLQAIATLQGLDDTTYFDNGINLNTSGISYSYRISLESLSFGFVGNSQLASSIFIGMYETDEEIDLSFRPNVPWNNDYYVIYRRFGGSGTFDSIGVVTEPFFRDTGLVNGDQYCYIVKSVGGYTASGFVDPIINFSQIACGTPVDDRPPCVPVLTVETNCDLAINTLNWSNPPDTVCDTDVAKYLVFFTPLQGADFTLIDSTSPGDVTTYEHFNNGSIAGCYAIVAVDSTGNHSELSNYACIDNDTCSVYRLPNVFTPNDDTYNDIYHPFLPFTSVERVDMTIFNRWGNLVYETEDPNINWDGRDINNGSDCSDGVYFYVCKVYEITLYGVVPREIRGSITLIRD
jgi:gliding motility-associated-like protein